MLFNSLAFAIFLPIVFMFYWFGKQNRIWQNAVLVVSSCVFYGWVDWRFLFLLAITSCTTCFSNRYPRKIWTVATICINLLMLGVFKYYGFFVESLASLFASIGIQTHIPTLQLILPIGISFYTFKAISYSVDRYKNLITEHNTLACLGYILFFPQLLAGPIAKASDLYPQLLSARRFDYRMAANGCKRILWGLFKKIAIANTAAMVVDTVFSAPSEYNSTTLLMIAILYAFQIYGDFSGYSDIAIGVGNLLGIATKKNFDIPYLAHNVAEFWKRWHISLNRWFVNYVYIPMGGNRRGIGITIANTFIIFLLSGLWHGANWTYILWGLYHAILFIPLLLLKKYRPDYQAKGSITLTFILVCIGWIIFRSENIEQAMLIFRQLADFGNYGMPDIAARDMLYLAECGLGIIVLVALEVKNRHEDIPLSFTSSHKWLNHLCYLVIALWTYIFYTVDSTFIYFQF